MESSHLSETFLRVLDYFLIKIVLVMPVVARLFSFLFQELQKAVDHRKAIILSINLCSSEFTQTDSKESHDLQDRLSQMNGRWDRVCSLLEDWRGLLQDALLQCQVSRSPALGR
jgi:hypothetical protein